MNEQFSSVFSDPKIVPTFTLDKNLSTKSMRRIVVSEKGVEKLMSKINENKATGPDGIPGKLLKICSKELAPVFRILFQASLDK